jgi:glutamate racemase
MPIGVFDSGVGGLSVLREVRLLMSEADIVYLADQARAPYGERSQADVRGITARAARCLIDHGADTLVLACNTASAAALHHLREEHPDIQFVGMEPAVKPAAAVTRAGVVGVLVTPSTFQARVVSDLAIRFAEGVEVIPRPCPGLADVVERLDDGADDVAGHVTALIDAGADAIVIGCTHYSFLADAIRRVAGPDIAVIDPAPAVARQVARIAAGEGSGTVAYLTTGDPVRFVTQIEALLDTMVVAEPVVI